MNLKTENQNGFSRKSKPRQTNFGKSLVKSSGKNNNTIPCKYAHDNQCFVHIFKMGFECVSYFHKIYLAYFFYSLFSKRKNVKTLRQILIMYFNFMKKPLPFIFINTAGPRAMLCYTRNFGGFSKKIAIISCLILPLAIFMESNKRAQELAAYMLCDAVISIWNSIKAYTEMDKLKDKQFDQIAYSAALAVAVSFYVCGVG